jgi:hypothetical protein
MSFIHQQVTIEMFGDLNTMSMEELVGWLQLTEGADTEEQEASKGHTEQLLLTKEQWEERRHQCGKERTHGGGARRDSGEKGDGHDGKREDDNDGTSTWSGRSRSRYRGKCFECGERGHQARDCPRKKEAAVRRRPGGDTAVKIVLSCRVLGEIVRNKCARVVVLCVWRCVCCTMACTCASSVCVGEFVRSQSVSAG